MSNRERQEQQVAAPGELFSVANHKKVAGTDQIYDYEKNKTQEEINSELYGLIAGNDQEDTNNYVTELQLETILEQKHYAPNSQLESLQTLVGSPGTGETRSHEERIVALENTSPTDYSERLNTIEGNISDLGTGLNNIDTSIQNEEARAKGEESRLEGLINSLDGDIEDLNNGLNNINLNILLQFKEKRIGTISDTSRFHAETTGCNPTAVFYYEQYKRFMVERNGQIFGYWGCGSAYNDYSPNGEDATPFKNRIYVDLNKLVYTWDGVTLRALGLLFENGSDDSGSQEDPEDPEETPVTIPEVAYGDLNTATAYSYYTVTETTSGVKYKVGTLLAVNSPEGIIQILNTPKNLEEGIYELEKVHTYTRAKIGSNWSEWLEKTGITTDEVYDETIAHSQQWINQIIGRVIDFLNSANGLKDNTVKSSTIGNGEVNTINLSQSVFNAINSYLTAINNLRTELREKDLLYATTINNLSNRIVELEQKENTLIDTNVAGFFIVDSEDNIGASFTSNYKGIGFDPKENYLAPYLKDSTWYLYNKPISKEVIPDGISDVAELIDGEEYIQSYGQQEMGSHLDSWDADDGKWIFYPYVDVTQQTYNDNSLDGPLTINNVTYPTVTVADKIEIEGTYYLEIAVPTDINYYEDTTPLEYTSGSGKKLIIPGADFSDLGYGKLSELEINNKFVLTIPTNTNSEYSSITITDVNDEEQELYQCFFNGTTYIGRLLQVHVDVNSSYQVDDSFYSNLLWDVIASSGSVTIVDTNPDYPEYKTFVFSPLLGEQEITIKCTDPSTNYSYKKTIKVKYTEPSFEIVLGIPLKYTEVGTFNVHESSYNNYIVTKSSEYYKIPVSFSRKILLDQIEVTSITWSSNLSYGVPNVPLTDFNKSCSYSFSRLNNVDNEVLTYTVNYKDKLSNTSSKSISRQITVSVINDYSSTTTSTTPAPNAAPSVVLRNESIKETVTVLEPVYYGTDTLADMEIESKNDSAIVENNVLTVVDSSATKFLLRGVMKNNETLEYEFELPNFTSRLVSIRIDSGLTAVMTAKKVQLGVLGTLENGETYYDDIPVYWSVTSDSDLEIASINEDGLLTINEGMSGHIVVKAIYKGDSNIYDIKGSTVYYLETPPVSMKYNNNTPKSDIQRYTRTPMSSDSERVLDYYIDLLSIHAYEGGSVNENDATEPNYIQCFVTIGATGKYKGDNGVTYSQPKWFEDSGNTRVSGRECIPLLETDSNYIDCLEDYSETLPSNKIVTLITKDGDLYDEYWMKYRVNDQVTWRVVSYGKAPRNSDANSSNNSNGFIPVDGGITINGSTVITTNTTTSAPSTTPAPGPNHIIGLVGNLSGPRFSTTEKGKLLIPNLDPDESDVIYEITVEATLKNRKGETITETETFSYSYQPGTQSVIDDNLELINTINDPQNYNIIYYYLLRGDYYNSLLDAKDNYQFRYNRSADLYLDDFKSKYIRVKKKVGVGYLVWPWDEPDEIWYPIRIGGGYTGLEYFFKLSGNPAKRANDLYDPNYEYNYVSALNRESKYESNLGWYFPKKSTDYMYATNWSFCAKPDGQLHKNEVRVYYILMPGGYAISKCYPTWDRILYSTRSIKNSPLSIQVLLNDNLQKIPGKDDYYFEPTSVDPDYLQGRDLSFGINNIIKSVTPYPIKQSNDPDPYDGAPIYCVVGTATIDGKEINCDYGWTTDENGNRIQQSIIYNDSKTKIIGGYLAYCVCTGNGYSFKVYGTDNLYKMVLLKVTWGTAETYVKFYVKYAPSRIDKF